MASIFLCHQSLCAKLPGDRPAAGKIEHRPATLMANPQTLGCGLKVAISRQWPPALKGRAITRLPAFDKQILNGTHDKIVTLSIAQFNPSRLCATPRAATIVVLSQNSGKISEPMPTLLAR